MFGNPSMRFNLMIRFEDRVRDKKETSCKIRENGQTRKHDKTVGCFNNRYRLRWMLGN